MQTTDIETTEEIYTVSRLNNEVRFILEDSFPLVWVEGEISNFAAPNSGHWYFSLKDASAQVRCAMFRGNQRKLNFIPKDGSHVLIKARVSLYENRGEFQLIAEDMEERGEGKLRRAFEVLKKKLEAAGLFDAAHKKPLPAFPAQIGVITSATGAAIKDILTVLKRRHPCASIIIYPTLVQGSTAAPTIVQAIETANRRNECDVLILARGGGSLEDLWPFNEEIVAHAIYHSQLPTITGIGHEIDFTIADFVADKRAPTPSAAAEIATPDCTELLQLLNKFEQRLLRTTQQRLVNGKQQLAWMHKHLMQQHPKRRLIEQAQRLDLCEMSLTNLIQKRIAKLQTSLANAVAKLDALSPLATLKRGYAIATDQGNNVLIDAGGVVVGAKVGVRLLNGSLDCVVEKVISSS
jgi:exodeoxyribonuclease VII large subunit